MRVQPERVGRHALQAKHGHASHGAASLVRLAEQRLQKLIPRRVGQLGQPCGAVPLDERDQDTEGVKRRPGSVAADEDMHRGGAERRGEGRLHELRP